MSKTAQASICIIEVEVKGVFYILLIQRTKDPKDYWSGHLSFPGGKIEKNETPYEAAKRETFEEVGLSLKDDHLVNDKLEIGFAGKKGIFGLWVKPYVFSIKNLSDFPELKLEANEISKNIWLKKSELLNLKNHCFDTIVQNNHKLYQPQYKINDNTLWGYSYRILCTYLEIQQMTSYAIKKLDDKLDKDIHHKINTKTKPLGSLGKLEKIAFQISKIQQTLSPKINKPLSIILAGDHGVCNQKVNPFPQEVTQQMVLNFIHKGAAINAFTNTLGIDLMVADCGTLSEEVPEGVLNLKVNNGTKDFSTQAAMSLEELEQCLQNGMKIVEEKYNEGYDLFLPGEMGIGNTTSASALFSAILKTPPSEVVGAGTGANGEIILNKIDAITKGLKRNDSILNSKEQFKELRSLGGFEIATMTGIYLACAQFNIPFVVDGFICTAAYLAAFNEHPEIKQYAIFSHISNEKAHIKILEKLEITPLLDLDLRLGEGTGAALSYPLIQSALSFLNQMSSFEDAGVSDS